MSDVTPSQSVAPEANPVDMIAAVLDAERAPVPEAEVAQPEAEAHEPSQNAQVEGDEPPAEGESKPVAEIPLEQLEAIELEVTVQGEKTKKSIALNRLECWPIEAGVAQFRE